MPFSPVHRARKFSAVLSNNIDLMTTGDTLAGRIGPSNLLGHVRGVQLELDAAGGLAADGDVEVDLHAGEGTVEESEPPNG